MQVDIFIFQIPEWVRKWEEKLSKLDCYKLRTEPKIVTITIEYFQNLDLPHLGYDQPGDFYYYSPINLYFWYFG